MRVLSSSSLRGEMPVVFAHPTRGQLVIRSRVAWCKRVRFGQYAAGIQFLGVSEEDRREILQVRSNALVTENRRSGLSDRRANVRPEAAPDGGASRAWVLVSCALIGIAALWLSQFVTIPKSLASINAWDAVVVATVLGVVVVLGVARLVERRDPKTRVFDEVEQLKASENILRRLLHNSVDGVVFLREIVSLQGREGSFEFQLVNPAAADLLGTTGDALLGTPVTNDNPLLRELNVIDEAKGVMRTGMPVRRESKVGRSNQWVLLTIIGVPHGVLVTLTDISERRRMELQLEQFAYNDPLTGLANRARLHDLLRAAVDRATTSPGSKFAVMFLDFDRFKVINDSLGHHVGDELLLSIARRLRRHFGVPPDQAVTEPVGLARLGGDEFVILINGVETEEVVGRTADDLIRELAAPHELDGHAVVSTASIGVVVADQRYKSPDDVLRDADNAMYSAKAAGKGCWVMFDDHMHAKAAARMQLERELRGALEGRQFELAFEPIVSLETGEIFAAEALLRWNHPVRGRMLPGEFLGLAEEIGIMPEIGRWVIRESCASSRRINEALGRRARVLVTFNVSRSEMLQDDLVEQVRRCIEQTGADSSLVCIEIPETHLAADHRRIKPMLAELRKLGVRVALDDFGVGHSSLHAVQELAIDILKIDRSLGATEGGMFRNLAVFNAVLELSRHLKLKVVAEGIEHPEQVSLLTSLSCGYAQGRLMGSECSALRLLELAQGPRLRTAA